MLLNLLSYDDFMALSRVLKQHGWRFMLNKLNIRDSKRAKVQWESYEATGSNWWDIPTVKERWNLKITGNENVCWEEYVAKKYSGNRQELSMLSVGCGTGEKERYFANCSAFVNIEGIDVSENSVGKARQFASKNNLINLKYHAGDFNKWVFKKESYDFVLFNSSLHHFSNIEQLLAEKIIPVLKPEGLVIIFEYTGPKRFQYSRSQVDEANKCLTIIPEHLKLHKDGTIKKKNYAPGLLRMWINDPSEAPCSEEILPALRKCFIPVEETPIGGALLHMLFKDIAHNFVNETPEVKLTLKTLFKKEDEYYLKTRDSDFWFGVYGKKQDKKLPN